MKKIIFIFMSLVMISCNKQKDDVEIIPNLEWEYMDDESVTEPAKPINKKFDEELTSTFNNLVKNWYIRNNKKNGTYYISFTIFIGENGRVEKIKDGRMVIASNLVASKYRSKEWNNVFEMDASVINEIKNEVVKWIFEPAYFLGKAVKYKKTLQAYYDITPDTNNKFELKLLDTIIPHDYSNDYFVMVEEMPSPIGGIQAIQQKIIYPELAKRAGIEGRVYVKAFIDETGNVASAEIIKGLDGGLSEAAMEAVKATKFEPGRQRGVPVKVQVSIPILFKLSNDEVKK